MKPVKRVDLSKLSAQQREAFIAFASDCAACAPQMQQLQDTAKAVFTQLLKAPQWRIVEAGHDRPAPPQNLWHVGAPQINYVDHIEEQP